jgi:hypothetical protein
LSYDYRGFFDPDLIGFHLVFGKDQQKTKARGYARGMGHVLKVQGFAPRDVLKWFVRPIGGVGVSLLRGRLGEARYYFTTAVGRLEGYSGHLIGAERKSFRAGR